ncbi:MAG: SDR family oxidoreductase [Cyclobacteriaceae bacterium]|nr:SDR family oxidoreductase [Cyclobacteriaceae bacterium]
MKTLAEKVILITGGSKGIGFGIAEALLQKGARVAITGRSTRALQAAAHKLKAYTERLICVEADVTSYDAQAAAVAKVINTWGRLDAVIANAGVGHFGSVETLTPAQWEETIATNLTGVFYSVKATFEALKNSQGYLITIASLAGNNFFENGAAYNASKFGLVGFTQAAMLDLRKHGIKVSTIMPGSVATEFNNHTPSVKDAWKIQPEDIGKLVVDLLEMNPRTLPSKIEVRPSQPPK